MRAGVVLVVAGLGLCAARAQTFPDHPVRLMIPFTPSGGIDTLGRLVAQRLGEIWGQTVFVENRAGAGGDIGSSAAAKAPPDGYTLALGGQFLASNVTILPMRGFDPVKDLDPIVLLATGQDVLTVPPNSPFRSVRELVDYAKSHPGELTYASLGVGASSHLSVLLLSEITGISLRHVPYTSFSQAFADVSMGRVSLWIASFSGAIGHIQAGELNALAVSGHARAAELPDVPTFRDLGIPYDNESWFGLFAPKGTSRAIIDQLNADALRVIGNEDLKTRAATLGFRTAGGTPEALGLLLQNEIGQWAEVAERNDLLPK
jgi:tripartite-type tricarboxylate transporter receptor subunit TctC